MENDTFHNMPGEQTSVRAENKLPMSQVYEDYPYLKPTDVIPIDPPSDPLNKLVYYSSGGVERMYIYNAETGAWSYVSLNASTPGGGTGWQLVSYSTAEDVNNIDITGLNLNSDIKYKVLVEYDTNGEDSLFYINLDGQYQAYYTYVATAVKTITGTTSSEDRGSGTVLDTRVQATSYESRSWSAEFEVHQLLNLAATAIKGEVGGYKLSTGAVTADFTGYLTTGSQITSINLSVNTGSASRHWRVWVFKPTT